jgi:hypothetical protein
MDCKLEKISMSKIGNIAIICVEEESICELCGKKDELRPYGPNGENICFDCGMKDEKTTQRQMGKILFGIVEQ